MTLVQNAVALDVGLSRVQTGRWRQRSLDDVKCAWLFAAEATADMKAPRVLQRNETCEHA